MTVSVLLVDLLLAVVVVGRLLPDEARATILLERMTAVIATGTTDTMLENAATHVTALAAQILGMIPIGVKRKGQYPLTIFS